MGRQGVNTVIVVGRCLSGHFYTRSYNLLLFQSLVEGFSIVLTRGIAMLTCITRRFMANNYLLFAGIAYLLIGVLDLVHALTSEGRGGFHGYDADPSTRLWIAARYAESISLALASLFLKRKLHVKPVFGNYAAIFTLLLAAILYGKFFPDCFIEGKGLGAFKIVSEYIISLILLTVPAFLFFERRRFQICLQR